MKETNLSFSEALELIKTPPHLAVQRAGWNGKGMFIYLNKGSEPASDGERASNLIDGVSVRLFETGDYGTRVRLPNLNMRSASGSTVTGWLASQTDLLAEDWQVAYPEAPAAQTVSEGVTNQVAELKG